MFTIDADTNEMTLTKNNTAYFTVAVKTKAGAAYTILATDVITFTVKSSVESKVALITKTANINGLIKIDIVDTDLLTPSIAYYYDIKITQLNGDASTIVPWSKFIVDYKVTS